MRVQHNITAMNAYRNYSNNTSALAKNLEKLSSGYKINRAGDDAAGLAISEKMRAQITGLEVAQKNAKDGISLVQTAEGALTEVHDMLNRMYELAEQSANGTYDDDVDRVQLQKEIDSLKAEIDRIADATNFNGINLLDGTMATSIKEVSSTEMREATFDDLITSSLPEKGNVRGSNTVVHKNGAGSSGTSFGVALHNVELSAAGTTSSPATMTITLKGASGTGTIKVTNAGSTALSAADIVNAIKTAASGGTLTTGVTVDFGGDKLAFATDTNTLTWGSQEIKLSSSVVEKSSGTDDDVILTFTQANAPTTASEVIDGQMSVQVSGSGVTLASKADTASGDVVVGTSDFDTVDSYGNSYGVADVSYAGDDPMMVSGDDSQTGQWTITIKTALGTGESLSIGSYTYTPASGVTTPSGQAQAIADYFTTATDSPYVVEASGSVITFTQTTVSTTANILSSSDVKVNAASSATVTGSVTKESNDTNTVTFDLTAMASGEKITFTIGDATASYTAAADTDLDSQVTAIVSAINGDSGSSATASGGTITITYTGSTAPTASITPATVSDVAATSVSDSTITLTLSKALGSKETLTLTIGSASYTYTPASTETTPSEQAAAIAAGIASKMSGTVSSASQSTNSQSVVIITCASAPGNDHSVSVTKAATGSVSDGVTATTYSGTITVSAALKTGESLTIGSLTYTPASTATSATLQAAAIASAINAKYGSGVASASQGTVTYSGLTSALSVGSVEAAKSGAIEFATAREPQEATTTTDAFDNPTAAVGTEVSNVTLATSGSTTTNVVSSSVGVSVSVTFASNVTLATVSAASVSFASSVYAVFASSKASTEIGATVASTLQSNPLTFTATVGSQILNFKISFSPAAAVALQSTYTATVNVASTMTGDELAKAISGAVKTMINDANADLAADAGSGTSVQLITSYQLAAATDGITITMKAATATVNSVTNNSTSDDDISSSGADYNWSTVDVNNIGLENNERLASTYFDIDESLIDDGATLTIGSQAYIFSFTTDELTTGSQGGTIGVKALLNDDGTAIATNAEDKLGELITQAFASNKSWSVGYNASTDQYTLVERIGLQGFSSTATKFTTFDDIKKSFGFTSATANVATTVTATAATGGLVLQIGDTADSYNQLTVGINSCYASAMVYTASSGAEGYALDADGKSLYDVDVSTQSGAAQAMYIIKNAINYISDVRGTLGATQNRLDHTINNLGVMQENIQDAESTIRDTDIAEEMMEYTKNSILVQSAQAMLAQANQLPQGVLQLLQ